MEQRGLDGFWEAPQEPGAVWQVDLFHLPLWVKAEEGDEPRLEMVWAAFGLDLPTGEIAMSRMAGAPEGALAVDALPELARRTGYRPERIQVTDLEVADKIRTALAAGESRTSGHRGRAARGPVRAEDGLRGLPGADRPERATRQDDRANTRPRSTVAPRRSTMPAGTPRRSSLSRSFCASTRSTAPRPAISWPIPSSICGGTRISQELLSRYRDASAFWTWPRVLLAFRLQGDSPETRGLLSDALRRNRFVPQALLAAGSRASEPLVEADPDRQRRRGPDLCLRGPSRLGSHSRSARMARRAHGVPPDASEEKGRKKK